MKAKVAMAYIVILAIPLTGFWSHGLIKKCCDETSAHIEEAMGDPSSPSSLEDTKAAIKHWQEKETLLTSFVTHEEVDAVLIALRRAEVLYEIGDEDEYIESLTEAEAHIKIVRDFDKLTLRSVF